MNWLDPLIDRRPVAFIGTKETSYAARYDLYPRGFVEMAARRGQAPGLPAQAETAARLLGDWRLDSARRVYEPWSFEADARGLVTAALARACLLLCQPGAYELTPAAYPGLARLGQFLARYGRDEPHPEPGIAARGRPPGALSPHVPQSGPGAGRPEPLPGHRRHRPRGGGGAGGAGRAGRRPGPGAARPGRWHPAGKSVLCLILMAGPCLPPTAQRDFDSPTSTHRGPHR